MDWSSVKDDIPEFSLPPCPARSTANALARWFDISFTRLTTLPTSYAPAKQLSSRWKRCWSQRLSSLRREYHRMASLSRQHPSPTNLDNLNSTRRTYFKAIASAKRPHWSDFLSSATPALRLDGQKISIWLARRDSLTSLRLITLPRSPRLSWPTFFRQDHLCLPFSHCHDMKPTDPLLQKRCRVPSPAPRTPPPLAPTPSRIRCGSPSTPSDPSSCHPSWATS